MLYSCHDALFDHDHEFGHLRRISYFFEWRKAYQQAFFRNNAMIKSFSLPRVCTYTVHASLEEDASAWKIANYVFYFCENHLLLLKALRAWF